MSGSSHGPLESVRLMVHALDRTGPAMLLIAFLGWLRENHPEIDVEVVAFRGGELQPAVEGHCRVSVLLSHHERWDHLDHRSPRIDEVTATCNGLDRVDATLLVSVAAGQILPYIADDRLGVLCAWVVEVGTDLRWLSHPALRLVDRVDCWFAGSATSAQALASGGLIPGPASVVPEFVDEPSELTRESAARMREEMGAAPGEGLVVAAGIGTFRKGPELLLEVAVRHRRGGSHPVRFVWIGGENDELLPLVRDLAERRGVENLGFLPSTPDISKALGCADLMVHPAREDAFPLVCLHSAASGTPVIAFRDSMGVAEMMDSAFVGPRYPDVGGIVREVDNLMDPVARSQVAAGQRNRVIDGYVTSSGAPRLLASLVAAAGSAGA